MNKTIIETYPRSGHHYLVNGLLFRLSDDIKYCEVYKHCNHVPCIDENTTLQKTHDFKLEDKILDGYKYIIQYRHPYESIVSYYILEAENPRNNLKYSLDSWKSFFKEKLTYWKEFMLKWCFNDDYNKDFYYLQYYDLINNQSKILKDLIEFLDLKTESLDKIKNLPKIKKTDIYSFRFFNEEDVKFSEQQNDFIIKKLNIKKTNLDY